MHLNKKDYVSFPTHGNTHTYSLSLPNPKFYFENGRFQDKKRCFDTEIYIFNSK